MSKDIDRFVAWIFQLHLQKFVAFCCTRPTTVSTTLLVSMPGSFHCTCRSSSSFGSPWTSSWPWNGSVKGPGTSSWPWKGGFEHPVTSSWPWNGGSEDLGTSSWPWNGGFESPWTASWPLTGDFEGPRTSSWPWNGDQNRRQVASANENIGFSLCGSCAKRRRRDFR